MSAALVPCPTCGAASAWSTDNPFRPFCSERCKLVDLGAWLEERYRIPGEPVVDEGNAGEGSSTPGDGTPGRLQ